ncbi:MAG: HAMP domain-containing sensor histidine kinase [Agriterribacter sp.]
MKKLLTRPLRAFGLYTFLVLMASIPVYYFIIDSIWLHELNKHNKLVAKNLKENIYKISSGDTALTEKNISTWNNLQPNTQIQKSTMLKPDSIYNIYKKNKDFAKEGGEKIDRFQGLITYFAINNIPYRFIIESNVEETNETVTAILLITIFFFILLLAGFIILNRIVSGKLWQPFYNTLAKIKSFHLNKNHEISFEKTGILEFEELHNSLNKLIEENTSIYNQQKQFTENASHELQTPLAVVQSKLDILLQKQPLSKEQSDIIDDANKALSRVSRINKNLLLLAKIENKQFSEKERVDVRALLSDNLELLEDFFSHKQISIKRDIQSEVYIEANNTLVEVLFTNLLLNAARHTMQKGEIMVTLTAGSFVVQNSGEHELKSAQLFKRFAAAYTHSTGSGLGLAIAYEICNLYNWKLNYYFKDGSHYFSVFF